ncbi:TPA: hypothetical protein ACGF38_003616 [Vibrio cholerae]
MVYNKGVLVRKILVFFYIVFLILVLSFPRILWELKVLFLFPLILFGGFRLFYGDKLKAHALYFILFYFLFYLWFGLVGLAKGNNISAILDEFRLQIFFPMFFLLFTFAQDSFDRQLSNFHNAVLMSCLVIFLSFLYLFLSFFLGFYIPSYFIQEFQMIMGVHTNYIQVNMESVGMLFFIMPYLITHILIKNEKSPILEFLALIIVIICALLSGRRALWICLLVSPFISLILIKLTGLRERFGLWSYSFVIVVGLIFLSYLIVEKGILDYVVGAFSSIDERTIQKPYLIDGFFNNLFIGSGIGGTLGYTRSESYPWLFELTYHQRLFNYGLLGFVLFHAMIAIYSFFKLRYSSLAVNSVRTHFISIFSGIVILLIGSYSNPYMGSFDFLFLMWLFFLYGCVGSRTNNVHK